MNRLLITGATGFLGLPCVARARASPFEVHALARRERETLGVALHPVDLFDKEAVSRLIAELRPSHLLHLAWIAVPGMYWTSPENYTWVLASQHLLQTFAEHGGRRAVLTGTCAEYDWSKAGVCGEHSTLINPSSLYGKCKCEFHEWASAFGAGKGLEVAWARLFFVYGPREHPARLVPSVARALLAGQSAECTSGTQERDFLHASDVADALVRLLEGDLTGPVNIGSGQICTVREVIETVAKACGRPELVKLGVRPAQPNEPQQIVADVRRLRDELKWRPGIRLSDGLKATVEWWRARNAA